MSSYVEHLMTNYEEFAFIISITLNILISIAGFIPSAFLTALNIKIFGLTNGLLISLLGEVLGMIVSFFLYRFGFQKISQEKVKSYPKLHFLLQIEGKKAFLSIISLRILPFIPSSLVTFFSAIGKVNWLLFLVASTFGKIPAILMEAYAVNEILQWTLLGKIALFGSLIVFLLFATQKRIKRKDIV